MIIHKRPSKIIGKHSALLLSNVGMHFLKLLVHRVGWSGMRGSNSSACCSPNQTLTGLASSRLPFCRWSAVVSSLDSVLDLGTTFTCHTNNIVGFFGRRTSHSSLLIHVWLTVLKILEHLPFGRGTKCLTT